MSKREPNLYIQDILDSISKIEEYIKGLSFEEFYQSNITIDAVVRNFEIIGEATRNIPKQIKDRYKEVTWRKIINMRNKVIHEYFGVDEEILWKTIKDDLPIFKTQIQKLLKEIS